MNAAILAGVLPGCGERRQPGGVLLEELVHCSAVTDASVATVGGPGAPGSDARKVTISVPSASLKRRQDT